MTHADIQARRDQLAKELETLKANLHATAGAIQDCDYWLEQLNKVVTDDQK